MGLLNAISQWNMANYEKKIERNRLQGTCPDCNGKGFHPWVLHDHIGMGSYQSLSCHGCDGSGLFSIWETQ
jgi:DnaJ-class molecular chaperone